MFKSMCKYKNRYFYPWCNHTKCCMDGKRIGCLQIVSQHVPIYLQQFPSYSNCKCKKITIFYVQQPTFLFPLETSLRLSRSMLHRWKDNSMLAKPLADCTYLRSIVSVSPKIAIFTTFLSPLGTPLVQSR